MGTSPKFQSCNHGEVHKPQKSYLNSQNVLHWLTLCPKRKAWSLMEKDRIRQGIDVTGLKKIQIDVLCLWRQLENRVGGHLLVSLFVSNVAVQIWIECVWGFSTKGATWKAAVACYQSCFVMKRRNAQGNFRVYTHRQKNRRDWCTILLWSHGVQTQRRGAHGSIKDSVQKENVPKYFGWVSS